MFKHFIKTVAIGALLSSSLHAMAQTEVIVKLKNAEEKKYVMENKDRFFFSDNKLFIQRKASDALVSHDLSAIQSLRFAKSTAGGETVFADGGALSLYPNPATDVFYFANGEGNDGAVSLYSADGTLVLRQKYSSEVGVSVSGIPDGMYIVEFDNQTFKLEKK